MQVHSVRDSFVKMYNDAEIKLRSKQGQVNGQEETFLQNLSSVINILDGLKQSLGDSDPESTIQTDLDITSEEGKLQHQDATVLGHFILLTEGHNGFFQDTTMLESHLREAGVIE